MGVLPYPQGAGAGPGPKALPCTGNAAERQKTHRPYGLRQKGWGPCCARRGKTTRVFPLRARLAPTPSERNHVNSNSCKQVLAGPVEKNPARGRLQ